MKMKMFSVYDSKAESFITPWFQPTHGLAERIFTDEVNNPKSSMNHHPEDFTLFYLGEYDPTTAIFDLEATPKSVITAATVKQEA